jgi:hypothetical protein
MVPTLAVTWILSRKSATASDIDQDARNARHATTVFRAEEDSMESVRSYSQPSEVNAEEGQVLVEGPDGVAVSLTPDAAEETGRRLIDAASQARRQEGN